MPNGMECIFQCENENSKVSHHHAICVKDESVGDQWQWQLFKLDGQVEDSMPFYESTPEIAILDQNREVKLKIILNFSHMSRQTVVR